MVFDWFRRKFDKPESESESVTDTEQISESLVAAEEELVVPAAEPELASEEVATDYLAWAKAAYQNIQQQEAAAVAVVEPESEPLVAETITANTDELEAETASSDDEEDVSTSDSEIDALDESEAIPGDEESLPIWARDDRQQRLEQLKAAAIETEVPVAPAADVEIGRAHV